MKIVRRGAAAYRSTRGVAWFYARIMLALLFFSVVRWADAATYYRVTHVVDGDTVDLERVGRVRLIGVDTPETVHPRKPVEYFGREASNFLKSLLNEKKVRLEYDQTRRDRFHRTLAYLYLDDGTFVNLKIVELGYGHAFTKYPFKYMERFREAERTARHGQRGLWADHGAESARPKPATAFTCSKKRCAEISTCDEAIFLLKTCGSSRLDGNHDGVPCEALCGH